MQQVTELLDAMEACLHKVRELNAELNSGVLEENWGV